MINLVTVGRLLKHGRSKYGYKITFLDNATAARVKPKLVEFLTNEDFIVNELEGAIENIEG